MSFNKQQRQMSYCQSQTTSCRNGELYHYGGPQKAADQRRYNYGELYHYGQPQKAADQRRYNYGELYHYGGPHKAADQRQYNYGELYHYGQPQKAADQRRYNWRFPCKKQVSEYFWVLLTLSFLNSTLADLLCK